jgi:hypothetical protein
MSSGRLPIHIDVILLPVLSGFRFQGLLLDSSSTWCHRVDLTLWSFGLVVHRVPRYTRACFLIWGETLHRSLSLYVKLEGTCIYACIYVCIQL